MTEFILVLTATASKEEAQAIADVAVEQHLAAAVHIVGPLASTYRWQNNTEKAEEWVCLLKTSKNLYEELENSIRAIHSYEIPGIVAIPVVAGYANYLDWYKGELKKKETFKEQMLRALDEAHENLFAAAIAAMNRGTIYEGEWGPREVLAHIIGWEAEAMQRFPQLIAGSSPLAYDDDAFNAAILTVLGDQSFEQVCHTLRQTHQRLMSLLKSQDESIFVPDNSVYQRVKAMTDHSSEHAKGFVKPD